MGLAKKLPKQQRGEVIGDLLLVNRKEVLLFVIQRLFPSSEAKPFFTASFSESQFFSFYSNSLLRDQPSPRLALGIWHTKESHSPARS
jgi:hypothetical protein